MNLDWDNMPSPLAGSWHTCDLEANGLLEPKKTYSKKNGLVIAPEASRIWMACHRDIKTGFCYDFIDDTKLRQFRGKLLAHNKSIGRKNVMLLPLSKLPEFWDRIGGVDGHNFFKYDAPLVRKLLKYTLAREKIWDTLIQSQAQFCDREYVSGSESGPHSVESWAIRIGRGQKVHHEDWLTFSVGMYKRCHVDVEIQKDIKLALEKERNKDKVECNVDWTLALNTEMGAAWWMGFSEQWGFPIDKLFALDLTKDIDKRLAEIEDELLPKMPFRLNFDRCGTKVNWEKYSELMLKNTDLSEIPLGWCWPEDLPNKTPPIWNPFKKNGELCSAAIDFWDGKEATEFVPEEPERFATPAITDPETGRVITKAIKARKPRKAKEAKDRLAGAYEDDAAYAQSIDPEARAENGMGAPIGWEHVSGPFTRLRYVYYNLGSNAQIIEYLTRYTKWEHTELTKTGNPKLTDDSYDSIGIEGIGEMMKEFLIRKSRRTNVLNFKNPSKGWLNNIRPDGRVTPINHSMGTPTARSRHANIVNVPSGGALLGMEMRQCWTAYESGLMLGSDAAGLEARVLAHFMEDEETANEIVHGDFHTEIWNLIPDFSDSRGNTKTIEYALTQ